MTGRFARQVLLTAVLGVGALGSVVWAQSEQYEGPRAEWRERRENRERERREQARRDREWREREAWRRHEWREHHDHEWRGDAWHVRRWADWR
jgi:hypothetical protein